MRGMGKDNCSAHFDLSGMKKIDRHKHTEIYD